MFVSDGYFHYLIIAAWGTACRYAFLKKREKIKREAMIDYDADDADAGASYTASICVRVATLK